MLDFFYILTKGGLVLWCVPASASEFLKIINDAIDKTILQVFLRDFRNRIVLIRVFSSSSGTRTRAEMDRTSRVAPYSLQVGQRIRINIHCTIVCLQFQE